MLDIKKLRLKRGDVLIVKTRQIAMALADCGKRLPDDVKKKLGDIPMLIGDDKDILKAHGFVKKSEVLKCLPNDRGGNYAYSGSWNQAIAEMRKRLESL